MAYNIKSYDDLHETFYQLVLPKYTLDQVPSESVENLMDAISACYEAGEINTSEDMITMINESIELGFTKSLYFKK